MKYSSSSIVGTTERVNVCWTENVVEVDMCCLCTEEQEVNYKMSGPGTMEQLYSGTPGHFALRTKNSSSKGKSIKTYSFLVPHPL